MQDIRCNASFERNKPPIPLRVFNVTRTQRDSIR